MAFIVFANMGVGVDEIVFNIARCFLREVSIPPKCCDTPLAYLILHLTCVCDTPFCNVSRDNCVIPHKNKHKRVLRYYRYKYRAGKSQVLIVQIRTRVQERIDLHAHKPSPPLLKSLLLTSCGLLRALNCHTCTLGHALQLACEALMS